jgi:hypothetical protein
MQDTDEHKPRRVLFAETHNPLRRSTSYKIGLLNAIYKGIIQHVSICIESNELIVREVGEMNCQAEGL